MKDNGFIFYINFQSEKPKTKSKNQLKQKARQIDRKITQFSKFQNDGNLNGNCSYTFVRLIIDDATGQCDSED